MFAGILFVLAGIMIAVYPPLLSMIAATVLVLVGAVTIAVAYYQKKLSRHFDNPAVEFFFRF